MSYNIVAGCLTSGIKELAASVKNIDTNFFYQLDFLDSSCPPNLFPERRHTFISRNRNNLLHDSLNMDIVGSSLAAVSLLWAPVGKLFYYVRNFKERAERLRCKMEELVAEESDLRTQINTAMEHQKKQLKSEVQLWLKRVEKLAKEVHDLETEISKNGRYVRKCIPNYSSRYKLGKLIVKRLRDVNELQEKANFSNGFFVDSFPYIGRILPTTGLVGEQMQHVSHRIWEFLVDVNTNKIGILGMGGIGKTSIMMHINNLLTEAKIFDRVIWVTVSKNFNLNKIQSDIARSINMEFVADEPVSWTSGRLLEHLREKKFILILDDLWHSFSLDEVGIPQPNRANGCKFVCVTRLMDVCRGMETQREIKLELLCEEDAWDLFISKAGPILRPEIEFTAKKLCEKCRGLPLAIITVGRAMRKIDDLRVWKNAVDELSSSRVEITGMEEDVFTRLKLSYDHLKNDRIRTCFLYCALYPEDFKIDVEELIEYWMAEGLIDEVGDRETEVNKGYTVLNELKDACLLEGIGLGCVKMHDLVRDLAVRITGESPRFMVKAAMRLKQLPREWMECVQWISVMDNSIEFLEDHPNSPNLTSLLLQRNPLNKGIANSFFLNMQSLKVLNLSGTNMFSLPESISSLCNLRALLLSFSMLKELPSIEMLKELRVLDLSYSRLKRLPHGIDRLVNLRLLDLSYSEKLKLFPSGVIQKLSHLEDLSMFKSKWRWSLSTKGVNNGADFKEITSSNLTNLSVCFEDLASFISYVRSQHWQVLRSYRLGVGLQSSFLPISKGTYSVEIQGCNLMSNESSIDLPNNVQQLELQGCHDITVLSKLMDVSNFGNLKQCYLSTCSGLEFITAENDRPFQSLEFLALRKLSNFKSICTRNVAGQTFVKLKSLHIHTCNNLNHVLPICVLQDLLNLEEIEVWNSCRIEQIVEDVTEVNTTFFPTSTVTLPKLRRLYLSMLPELRCISRRVLICTSLDTVDIWDCQKLTELPFSVDYLPSSLKHIKGSRKWWDGLVWNEPNCQTLLQPFFDEGT